MSVKHITWVFEDTELTGSARLMMLAIADYADEVGACFPSYRRLAEKCNITRRNAIKTINRLVDNGHIGIRHYAGIETQNGNTNRFYMLKWRAEQGMDNSEFTTDTSDAKDTSVATDTPTSVATDTPTSVATDTLTVGNRSLTVDAPNGDARPRKRDEVFDWLAVNIFNQDAERIAKRAGGRIAKAKKSLQEIHALHGTELTPAHLDKFVSWWKREYAGLAMPMADDKLAQYYGEFYASQKNKATQSVQTHERTLVMRAQMALGYERIDPSYVDATIKEKMEELRDGYYDVI